MLENEPPRGYKNGFHSERLKWANPTPFD